MGKINAALTRLAGQRVYIDTNIFIYFFDQHPRYFEVVAGFLTACADRQIFGFTGDAAVAQVMVGPYRKDDPTLAERFKLFFGRENFLTIAAHDSAVFDAAARLVARKRLKFIDALHVATAVKNGCPYFITNDTGIASSDSLEVVQIGNHLAST